MSLLAYDDPSDTDEFGMRRSSVISTDSTIPPTPDPNMNEITDLRTQLIAAQDAAHAAENKSQVLEAELTRFKEQHAFVSASKEAVQQQLREETVRREAAEEKVELLRGQVEQARRTVMTLQKQEQDRAAIRAASISGAPESTEDPSNTKNKRQSLYGRGRPMSTMSVSSDIGSDNIPPPPPIPTSGLRELRLGGHARSQSLALRVATDGSIKSPRAKSPRSPGAQPSAKPRTASDGFDDPKSPTTRTSRATSLEGPPTPTAAAPGPPPGPDPVLLATQAEVFTLRQQLEALSIQYTESEEARLASETCVNALRDFIASDQQSGTVEAISLPPLPTDKAADDIEEEDKPPATPGPDQQSGKWGWWGKSAPTSTTSTAPNLPPITSPKIAVTPPERSPTVASSSISSPPLAAHPDKVDEDTVIAPPAGGGLGRSLSSFFGRRRGSKASTTTAPAGAYTDLPKPVTRDHSHAVNATALGLQLEDLEGNLPPPPSAPDADLTPLAEVPAEKEQDEPVPTTAPLNIRRSPSPSPRSPSRKLVRSPELMSSPIAIAPVPVPARSPARSPAAKKLSLSPSASASSLSRADSPPPASITTNEDDLFTPVDSPNPEEGDFSSAPATPLDADEESDAAKSTGKPTRTPTRSGATRRGSKASRARGARRGAAA